MTIAERINKLKHFIACLKCEVSGKPCDVNCSTQYDAGNMGEIIENLEAISKALEQEPQTFKWCTDCKEYDQEKHCCHRWSKVIRDTVEEMKQEQEPKTGHWIKGYTFPDGEYWKCDKCNELIKVKYPMYYCNNCGSDNREVKE
jgi:hypothetical protein